MLKVISKSLATLKLMIKYSVKEALILELLKENKQLKVELKSQRLKYSSEITTLQSELYDERLYNRAKENEFNKYKLKQNSFKDKICVELIEKPIQKYM